jgi:hypothetical protein
MDTGTSNLGISASLIAQFCNISADKFVTKLPDSVDLSFKSNDGSPFTISDGANEQG